MEMKLSGKVALVTGGARGIGRAIAIGLAENGADVVVNYARDDDSAKEVVTKIEELGKKCFAIKADVSKNSEVLDMVDQVWEKYVHIDILVNNAGICPQIDFLEIPEEKWDEVLGINLKGTFLCTQAVAKLMVKEKIKGRIINISSTSSWWAGKRDAHYCVSKAGMNALTRATAVSLGSFGITANALLPGPILTDKNRAFWGDIDVLKSHYIEYMTPVQKLGETKDMVGPTVFLASDESEWVTGACIVTDGGAFVSFPIPV